jgi:predicted NAD/FAD-binding protein
MTTSISRDQGRFEWATSSFETIFAQRQNLFNPRFWRLLLDILRLNRFALDLLKSEEQSNVLVRGAGFRTTSFDDSETVAEYLEREGYSKVFRNDYLIPTTVDIWSSNSDTGFDKFPVVNLVQAM